MSSDAKLSRELREVAKKVQKILDKHTEKRMAFSLLIFNDVPGSRMQYISNVEREDVIDAMRSLLKAWEEGMPDVPAHKIN